MADMTEFLTTAAAQQFVRLQQPLHINDVIIMYVKQHTHNPFSTQKYHITPKIQP